MKSALYLFFFCSPFFSLGQSINISQIQQSIADYSQWEKVYLHTDRAYYTAGGDIFFKVYVTDEKLAQNTSKSKVIYVDLVSPNHKIIETKIIGVEQGSGKGDFKINSTFKSGHYTIRAYTNFMRNFEDAFFFRKPIYIRGVTNLEESTSESKQTYSIQFFPEGGDLVNGLESTIAIKAVDNKGKGVSIDGKIIDEKNQEVVTVQTNEKGFGKFQLTPKSNQFYIFKTEINGQIIQEKLPEILPSGVVIKTSNLELEIINIQITTNDGNFKNGTLIGHHHGKIFMEKKLTNNPQNNFVLDATEIPVGILHFTVFDNSNQPRAERLMFNYNGLMNFNVDIKANQTAYQSRQKVQLKLDIYDDEGEVLPADLSLSVTENLISNPTLSKENIQSYLLLSADLKGQIEQPIDYFKDSEIATRKSLDLLLMTQGWRRFVWQDILKTPTKNYVYQPETGLAITGTTTEINAPTKPVQSVGFLSELSNNFSMLPFESNTNGQFSIENIQTKGEVEMILQAAKLDKKQQKVKKGDFTLKGNRDISIKIDNQLLFPISEQDVTYALFTKNKSISLSQFSNLESIKYDNDPSYEALEMSIDIDSIEVTAKKIDKIIQYYEDGMLYNRPDTRVKMESIADPNQYQNIHDVLNGRVPGMQKSGNEVIIRGRKTGLSANTNISNAARFMVNGSFVSQGYAESINPMDIAFVDVLKSFHQLTAFGEMGSNGLIMIYLVPPEQRNRARKKTATNGILNFTFKGYDEARQFYTPKYEGQAPLIAEPDNRITLHWQPTVFFNEIGEAVIEFYTSDRLGTYNISLEGISQNGLPIIASSKIIVK